MNDSGFPWSDPPRWYRLYGKSVLSQYPLPVQMLCARSGGKSGDYTDSGAAASQEEQDSGPDGDSPDIRIYFDGIVSRSDPGTGPSDHPPDTFWRVWKQLDDGNWMLRYYGSAGHMSQFLIAPDGSQIRVSQSWPEWRDTLFALINPACAAALFLAGHPLVHASSLVTGGTAFLISGVSGAGKSTLSAALAAEGMALHSDDIAAMDPELQTVAPGYPLIKVDPELPAGIGLDDVTLLPVRASSADTDSAGRTSGGHKSGDHKLKYDNAATHAADPAKNLKDREDTADPKAQTGSGTKTAATASESSIHERWIAASELPGGFYGHPAPVGGLFILTGRDPKLSAPKVTRISGMRAGIALAEHLYGPDWLQPPGPGLLSVFSSLAGSIPVYQVEMPDGLSRLRSSARMLISRFIGPLAEGKLP